MMMIDGCFAVLSSERPADVLALLGSNPGTDAIALIAPVVGSRATAAPPKPEAPGVLAIATDHGHERMTMQQGRAMRARVGRCARDRVAEEPIGVVEPPVRLVQGVGRDPLDVPADRQGDVGPLLGRAAKLVDDRRELVLVAHERVVLGALDAGLAGLDEAVAHGVAE